MWGKFSKSCDILLSLLFPYCLDRHQVKKLYLPAGNNRLFHGPYYLCFVLQIKKPGSRKCRALSATGQSQQMLILQVLVNGLLQ